MTLAGTYDDSSTGHPLTGTAEIEDFQMRNAPVLGKLLQAMTLYGLLDVLRGPGWASPAWWRRSGSRTACSSSTMRKPTAPRWA